MWSKLDHGGCRKGFLNIFFYIAKNSKNTESKKNLKKGRNPKIFYLHQFDLFEPETSTCTKKYHIFTDKLSLFRVNLILSNYGLFFRAIASC